MDLDFETALPLDDDLWSQFLTDDVPSLSDSSSPTSTPSSSQPLSPASPSPQNYVHSQAVVDTAAYLEAELFTADNITQDVVNALTCDDIKDMFTEISPELLQQQACCLLEDISFNSDLLSDSGSQVSPFPTVPEVKLELSSSSDSDSKEREKKKSTKKRRNCSEPLTAAPSCLDEDELVKLNRSQLEATTKQLQATGAMTPEEIKELKKRRRLLKNREYAQLSRHRKRAHVDELECKLKEQMDCNQELVTKNTSLMLENQMLRQKTSRLQKMLQQSALIASFLKNISSVSSKKGATIAPAATAASVCLMVLLLSFGVFFNQDSLQQPLPPKVIGEAVSHVATDIPKYHTGRNMLSTDSTLLVCQRDYGYGDNLRFGGDLKRHFGEDSKLHFGENAKLQFGMLLWENGTTVISRDYWVSQKANTTVDWQSPTTFILAASEICT